MKLFQENCIGKIIAQDQGKTTKMRVMKQGIDEAAQEIKSFLFRIYQNPDCPELLGKAIELISEFNRNCRRLRSKKK